jgi:drug/metabolite transporter (DMT)-like permease
MVTSMVTICGVALGVIVWGEDLSWKVYLGCGLILSGVLIVNGLFKALHLWRTAEAKARV